MVERILGAGGVAGTSPGAELPALFVSRFNLAVNPELTRIAFGHRVDGVDFYHSAIMLTTADAAELASLLTKLIAESQQKARSVKPS